MTDHKNLLIIEPSDKLKFYQPFAAGCQTALIVTNPTPYTVYFKLKTTASQRYCVKPKMGVISPFENIVVNFKLKISVTDLSSVEEDKFKLLYFEHSSESSDEPEKAWEAFDEASAHSIKLPVVFSNEAPPSSPIDPTFVGAGENSVKPVGAPGENLSEQPRERQQQQQGANGYSTVFDTSSIMSWIKLLAFIIVGGVAAYIAQIVDLKPASSSIFN